MVSVCNVLDLDILYFVRRIHILHKAYILIPVLLCVQIFGRAYVQNTYDINQYIFWFRNALTFGIPFTLLGMWIAEYEETLNRKISIKSNLIIILSGFGLIVIEFLTHGQYMDLHVSTVVISFGLFLLAARLRCDVPKLFAIFLWIGSKWYMWIYLIQMFIINLMNVMAEKINIKENPVYRFMAPFAVCVLACACAEGIVRIKKKYKT